MLTDLVLFEQWRSGSRSAGEMLFDRYFVEIHRFFRRRLASDADELTQRTFLACVNMRDRFQGHSSFRTFLYGIAHNVLRKFFRPKGVLSDPEVDPSIVADVVTSISQRMARVEQGTLLHRALKNLSEDQQTLLQLHYWHDLDAQALAEVVQASPGTVRVRLHRARLALSDELKRVQGAAEGTELACQDGCYANRTHS